MSEKQNSEIQTFRFEGHGLRVQQRDGKIWFFAADACDCLEIKNVSQALKPLDADEKGICNSYTLGGAQEQLVVSEGGLWTVVLRSRKAITPGTVQHRFRRWVTGEVIPSIRKTGSYSMPEAGVSNLDEATRRVIGGMIKRNSAVAFREEIAPLRDELVETRKSLDTANQRIADLENRVQSPNTCTAHDLWTEFKYPGIRGGTVWLGNRLAALGCSPEYGSRVNIGGKMHRVFDIGKARTAMKNGLALLTEQYLAERKGQFRMRLVQRE
ncbi:BRO-N domain-containing protein [Allorhizobium borbori]|uniref:Prophage antirepressor-like protein n=1 Tax=Allorhizobium borbori TaxID=485907 RepID=A0A7W6P0R5_9HYPH|nr:BRO family protein [Allorhizobium borbori]MBB4103549.1 prophage antirepressor-like protein [Allorhizobium borbori]